MANKNLTKAKNNKNDEFYTRLVDIEKECYYYRDHFNGKVIYCNCDDPEKSQFFVYFKMNFEKFNLKKLIATCYNENGFGKVCEYTGDEVIVRELNSNGDFRSDECISYLKESDIIISNPPFSQYRDYISLIMEHKKDFLVIGNVNAITYKETFPYIKDNKMWLGMSPRSMMFIMPDGSERSVNACWFTNMTHEKRKKFIDLYKNYKEEDYPKYDNYKAIEVNKTSDIPIDYQGVMGVPVTFLEKYCPEQFEIVGQLNVGCFMDENGWQGSNGKHMLSINGKDVYKRILIKHKKQQDVNR